ncbi:MAG: hypothetical protein C0408_05440 [Odoribacter sp.]|nr:hypothetical protein [Odoribacter sp.]
MPEKYLFSSAYFPPVPYISLIYKADNVFVENEENYLKQTYRNRCLILSANGPSVLSVPVLSGSFRKTPVKDIKIDYSKRWQQVHLRALISSYKSSPFFEYYFEDIEKILLGNPKFLLELNMKALETVLQITGISTPVFYTKAFEPVSGNDYDFRYTISPKKEIPGISSLKDYYQVFSYKFGFVPRLSILDLIFNVGPDSINYL